MILNRTYRADWNIGVKPRAMPRILKHREKRMERIEEPGQFSSRKYDDLLDHGNNIISLFYLKPLCAPWKRDAVERGLWDELVEKYGSKRGGCICNLLPGGCTQRTKNGGEWDRMVWLKAPRHTV